MTSEGELELSILMERKGVSYMLTRFPEIREFNSMLERLTAGGRWQAREFLGGTTTADGTATRFFLGTSDTQLRSRLWMKNGYG